MANLTASDNPWGSLRIGVLPRAAMLDLAVFLLPLLVYMRTMAPTVYGLDSAELTTGAYTLGIVHAPGSPLYLLAGHLFTWLPVGDVGYRLNLLSAVCAAAAVYFVYRTVLLLTGKQLTALAAAWLLAFSYYFWISALAAELYAPLALFTALCLFLVVRWHTLGSPAALLWLGFVFGLGLGNHLSLILLAPGLSWIACLPPRNPVEPRKRSAWLGAAGALCIMGSLIYLYLPIRYQAEPALNYARDYWGVNLATWNGFWWMVSSRMFASLMWSVPLQNIPQEVGRYIHQLSSNFLFTGVVVGVIGIGLYARTQRGLQTGLLLLFLTYLSFYLAYGAGDKEVMFLPSFVIWAIWLGLGVAGTSNILTKRLSPAFSMLMPGMVLCLAAGAAVFNFRLVDISHDWSARQMGEEILEAIPANSRYFGTWVDTPVLEYLQIVEKQRPDVMTRNLFFLSPEDSQRAALRYLDQGYPVISSAAYRFDTAEFRLKDIGAESLYQIYRMQSNPTGFKEEMPWRNMEPRSK